MSATLRPADEVELLIDRGQAGAQRVHRGGEGDGLAGPADLAGVRAVRAGEDLDQGRLAGAVLSEQAVHFTGADIEVDPVQGADAGKRLHDARSSEQRVLAAE